VVRSVGKEVGPPIISNTSSSIYLSIHHDELDGHSSLI
jgi:hypothetical protein